MCRADNPNDLSRLTVLYEVSRLSDGSFINAAPVVHRSRRGNPSMVYFWGSGDYRRSHVFLARVPLAEIDDPSKSAWRYWNGVAWIEHEPDAMPLFVDQPPGVGELSAAWIAPLPALAGHVSARGSTGCLVPHGAKSHRPLQCSAVAVPPRVARRGLRRRHAPRLGRRAAAGPLAPRRRARHGHAVRPWPRGGMGRRIRPLYHRPLYPRRWPRTGAHRLHAFHLESLSGASLRSDIGTFRRPVPG